MPLNNPSIGESFTIYYGDEMTAKQLQGALHWKRCSTDDLVECTSLEEIGYNVYLFTSQTVYEYAFESLMAMKFVRHEPIESSTRFSGKI